MDDNQNLILKWSDLSEAAEAIIHECAKDVKLDWLERGWRVLTKAGLTNCLTTLKLCKSQLNFLALFSIFAEAAAFVAESDYAEPDWAFCAKSLAIDPICMGCLVHDREFSDRIVERDCGELFVEAGSKKIGWKNSTWLAVENIVRHLIHGARPQVHDVLRDYLGRGSDSLLFANLWISTHSIDDLMSQMEEELELVDYEPEEIDEIVNPQLAIKFAIDLALDNNLHVNSPRNPAFEWVCQGCPMRTN